MSAFAKMVLRSRYCEDQMMKMLNWKCRDHAVPYINISGSSSALVAFPYLSLEQELAGDLLCVMFVYSYFPASLKLGFVKKEFVSSPIKSCLGKSRHLGDPNAT